MVRPASRKRQCLRSGSAQQPPLPYPHGRPINYCLRIVCADRELYLTWIYYTYLYVNNHPTLEKILFLFLTFLSWTMSPPRWCGALPSSIHYSHNTQALCTPYHIWWLREPDDGRYGSIICDMLHDEDHAHRPWGHRGLDDCSDGKNSSTVAWACWQQFRSRHSSRHRGRDNPAS